MVLSPAAAALRAPGLVLAAAMASVLLAALTVPEVAAAKAAADTSPSGPASGVTSATPANWGARRSRPRQYIALYAGDFGPQSGSSAQAASATVMGQRAVSIAAVGGTKTSYIASTVLSAVSFVGTADVARKVEALPGVSIVEEAVERLRLRNVLTSQPGTLTSLPQPASTPASACESCNGLIAADPGPKKEAVPYGLAMVQANTSAFAAATGGTSARGVTVCIVDTGIDARHPDLKDKINNITGFRPASFFSDLYEWDVTNGDVHATHVAGTVAAPSNGLGVVGVINGGANVYAVNVFGGGLSSTSWTVLKGVEACYLELKKRQRSDPKHKMVISMSLGGGANSTIEEVYYDFLYNTGDILVVSASGNEGEYGYESVSFPAAYDSVVSVAAVDCNETVADFSTYNDDVELAAPGVDVLSTLPLTLSEHSSFTRLSVKVGATTTPLDIFTTDERRTKAARTFTAKVADCGSANKTCPRAVRSNVCLIDRGKEGSPVLCSRVRTCMAAGARAVLVVANECSPETNDYLLDCTYYDPTCRCSSRANFVPTFALSSSDGAFLRSQLSTSLTITLQVGTRPYAAFDGTSMATPHVSAVAAKIWNSFRNCPNDVIRQALAETAKDLGDDGRDPYYGFGLIQGVDAATWLSTQSCPAA